MFTPHGKGWTGLSTPAPAPVDQQIGGAAVVSPTGRGVPAGRIAELEKEVCSIVTYMYRSLQPLFRVASFQIKGVVLTVPFMC